MNRAGAGPWSDALEVVSGAGAPDPPSAPVADVVKSGSGGGGGVRLKWDCPINNGAVISEYVLQMAVLESRKAVVASSTSTSASASPAGSPLKRGPGLGGDRGRLAAEDLSDEDMSECSDDEDEDYEEDESDDDEEEAACDDEESLVSRRNTIADKVKRGTGRF